MFVKGADSIEDGRSLVLAGINEACGPLPLQKEGSVGQIKKKQTKKKHNDRMTKDQFFRYAVISMSLCEHVHTTNITT